MIEEIFNELNPYLLGVEKSEGHSIIKVEVKKTWLIPSHETISQQSLQSKKTGMVKYMFYSGTNTFDDIINWVKTDFIDMNLEVEQKELLLKNKVDELKEMFETTSLEDLKKLSFVKTDNTLKLKGSTRNKTEDVNSEVEDVNSEVEDVK
jgi:hypothetical protein